MQNKRSIIILFGAITLLSVLSIHPLWIHTTCSKNSHIKTFHFSIDDVSQVSSNLADTTYTSIFEEPILEKLRELHQKYGAVFSLYCMGDYCINSKYSDEIIENSNWLKWGYHGLGASSSKRGISKFHNQVKDSVGSLICIDKCVRIDYYAADFLTCLKLLYFGYRGVFTADDWGRNPNRNNNYYLTNKQCRLLNSTNTLRDFRTGLYFFKTDFRLEHIASLFGSCKELEKVISTWNSDVKREMVVFCHEITFLDNIKQIDSIMSFSQRDGYYFDYILK